MAKSPAHYGNSWGVGDFIRQQRLNFHLGNAIKYICRADYKGSKVEDLKKAIHYLENEIQYEESLAYDTSERVQRILSNSIWDEWETETESFDR